MTIQRFIGVGACYIDTILSVPHFITEDEKLRASSISRRRGGNCPNTIEVLQQLLSVQKGGVEQVNLLAVLPAQSSPAIQEIQRSLGPGVSISTCIYREGQSEPPSSYIIRNQATDSRSIINYNALQEMTRDEFIDVVSSLGHEATWCHFEGRIPDATLDCLRHLRQEFPHCKISVELEKPARQGLQDLVPEADVIFYSKSWALGSGYSDAEQCLREQARLAPKATLLCCSWGAQGASCFDPQTQEFSHGIAFLEEGKPIVDTIGAGDTLIAGVLYSYLVHSHDWPLAKKLRFANELAGRKVAQEGFGGLARLLQEWL